MQALALQGNSVSQQKINGAKVKHKKKHTQGEHTPRISKDLIFLLKSSKASPNVHDFLVQNKNVSGILCQVSLITRHKDCSGNTWTANLKSELLLQCISELHLAASNFTQQYTTSIRNDNDAMHTIFTSTCHGWLYSYTVKSIPLEFPNDQNSSVPWTSCPSQRPWVVSPATDWRSEATGNRKFIMGNWATCRIQWCNNIF